jgi:hypothetical protein
MKLRVRNLVAVGALTSGLIAGGAVVANAATTTPSTSTGTSSTSGTSGSTSTTPSTGSTGSSSSGSTKNCPDMGTGSGSHPAQGEGARAPSTASPG